MEKISSQGALWNVPGEKLRAKDIWTSLGGHRVTGGYLVHCPCPSHGKGRGDKNPSLLVKDGDTRTLVKCFGGCSREDVLSSLRSIGLLEASNYTPAVAQSRKTVMKETPAPDAGAVAIWNAAQSAAGSPVETYLLNRGITIRIPSVLRFGRAKYSGLEYPTMVAALQDESRQLIAVQETFLTWDGRKAEVPIQKKVTGRMFDCAVQLDTLPRKSPAMGLAEGIESALSAMQFHHMVCWASLSAGRLPYVKIPSSVTELVIYGDNDGSGHRAAKRASETYQVRVTHCFPPTAKDWNGHLQAVQRIVAGANG